MNELPFSSFDARMDSGSTGTIKEESKYKEIKKLMDMKINEHPSMLSKKRIVSKYDSPISSSMRQSTSSTVNIMDNFIKNHPIKKTHPEKLRDGEIKIRFKR